MSLFVVLEGGEGSGKSTLAAALARELEPTGLEIVLTREPGGTIAGERVRELLHLDLVPWAEAFAYLVARAQLVNTLIRPALERGALVVCDRFSASTLAYQGYGRGMDLHELRAAGRLATSGLEPDLTLWVDIDPHVGLARKRGEAEALRTGGEPLQFHERVRAGYRAQAQSARPGDWVRLDGAARPDTVLAGALAAVRQKLA